MASIVVWTLVALAVAVVVMVVALVSSRNGGVRQFLGDLRAGLRPDARRGLLTDLRAEADDTDAESSVDQIFSVGQPADTAYLDPTFLTHRRPRTHPVGHHHRRVERTPSA